MKIKKLNFVERERHYFTLGNYLIKTPKWRGFGLFSMLNSIAGAIKANLSERFLWKTGKYDRHLFLPYMFSMLGVIAVFRYEDKEVTYGEYCNFFEQDTVKCLDFKWNDLHMDSVRKYKGQVVLINYGT